MQSSRVNICYHTFIICHYQYYQRDQFELDNTQHSIKQYKRLRCCRGSIGADLIGISQRSLVQKHVLGYHHYSQIGDRLSCFEIIVASNKGAE